MVTVGTIQDFKNLRVWQLSRELAVAAYHASSSFPKAERYGLASQLRRAATSIAANIAEGANRGSDRDFARFLRMAVASTSELESPLSIAHGLGYLPSEHKWMH